MTVEKFVASRLPVELNTRPNALSPTLRLESRDEVVFFSADSAVFILF